MPSSLPPEPSPRRLAGAATLAAAVVVALIAAGTLGACAHLLRAPVPMRTVEQRLGAGRADCLVVLLPGRGSSPEDFTHHHFADLARQAGADVDFLAADARLGYYYRHTLLDRLQADVIAPARARGYRQIWLAGISLGGTSALLYTQAHPADVTGILLLAPFLGDPPVVDEIAATGLAAWPTPAVTLESDFERDLWRFLQPYARRPQPRPPLYLAYGTHDRFARAHALLAAALPADHVFTAPGGHDWPTWTRLWNLLLAAPILPRAHPASDPPLTASCSRAPRTRCPTPAEPSARSGTCDGCCASACTPAASGPT
jgi:pimeloyl-ACP methyl ester carboxylesterase